MLLAALALSAAAVPALAQALTQAQAQTQTQTPGKPAASAAAARPDLSGFWMLSRQQKPVDAALVAKLPPNTALLDDSGAVEFVAGAFGGLKLKPAARDAAARWKPENEMTVSRACARPSIVYATQGPFPFEILQGTEFIIFRYEYFDLVRIIFMDGRGHPGADAPHSKVGHSIGHWEGDELVVDTTHLERATITNNGLDHSDNIHVVERFKRSPDGKTLMSTMWFEDPEVLDNNGARYIQWHSEAGQIYPYDCDPAFGANYTNAPK
ncbi:MAG: hypothetical protein JWM38_703 [Sphingomonas bacterium]|nr:hypothetical protein [Sphingomonas bacterium]